LEADRLRLIAKQADREAVDTARKRAEVIDFEDAKDVCASMASLVSRWLGGVAGRLGSEQINEPTPAIVRE